jgi:hypothetical protein
MNLTSKKVNIQKSEHVIFNMLINCNNIGKYISTDKVQDFQSTETACTFTIAGAGKIEMKLQEKNPFSSVSYTLGNALTKEMTVFFHIEKIEENACDLHITSHLDLPFFMAKMVDSSLQKFIDMLVDYIKTAAENDSFS